MERTEQPEPAHKQGEVPERYKKIKKMIDAGTEYDDLPGVEITANRLVAYNMAYFRKAAGLKQDELAERLNRGPGQPAWTNASISAAERSWDGKRVRQFDADVILSLATALGVPMSAFFLPPEDDGVKQRYHMFLPDVSGAGRCMYMRDVLEFAANTAGFQWEAEDESDGEESAALKRVTATNERYRQRLESALAFYDLDEDQGEPTYAEDAWGVGDEEPANRDRLYEKLERTRYHYEALRQLLGDIARVQDDLHAKLGMANQERLTDAEAKAAVARFRAGESVDDIAQSLGRDPWSVEKALIDAREGFLRYSPELQQHIFVRRGSAASLLAAPDADVPQRLAADVEAERRNWEEAQAAAKARAEAEDEGERER